MWYFVRSFASCLSLFHQNLSFIGTKTFASPLLYPQNLEHINTGHIIHFTKNKYFSSFKVIVFKTLNTQNNISCWHWIKAQFHQPIYDYIFLFLIKLFTRTQKYIRCQHKSQNLNNNLQSSPFNACFSSPEVTIFKISSV